MSASAGLQNEQNFMAQWMSNTSRAGVILNPPVDFGNPIKSTWAEQDGNDSFSTQFAPLSSSNSSCISVDSLHGGVVSVAKTNAELEPSSFDISSAITAFQSTALHHVQETEEDGVHEEDSMEHHFQDGARPNQQCTGPLMQKLEQLKEWQHQKQEQLKLQQMYQLHKLLEEQQKLLQMVNAEQTLPAPVHRGSPEVSQLAEGRQLLALVGAHGHVPHPELQNPTSISEFHNSVARGVSNYPLQKTGRENALQSVRSNLWGGPNVQYPAEVEHEVEDEEDSDKTLEQSNLHEEQNQDYLHRGKDHDVAHTDRDVNEYSHQSPERTDISHKDDLEERPIKPGIGSRKQTFEELLEEQLRLEEQRLKEQQTGTGVKANPKRTFLKRGEGLSRYSKARPIVPSTQTIKSDIKTQPTRFQSMVEHKNAPKTSKHQVQRKTAMLNKENCIERLPAPRTKPDSVSKIKVSHVQKTMVLGNHHGQNISKASGTKPPGSAGKSQEGTNEPALSMKIQGNKMETAKTVDAAKPTFSDANGQRILSELSPNITTKGAEYSFDISFQRKLETWDKEKEEENIELDEFELLEQAADEISFSSNSSFVLKVLHLDQRGLKGHRLSSTPIKSAAQTQQPTTQSDSHTRDGKSPTVSHTIQDTLESVRQGVKEMGKQSMNLEIKGLKDTMSTKDQAIRNNKCDQNYKNSSDSCRSDSDSRELHATLQDEKKQDQQTVGPSGCQYGSNGQYDKAPYQDGAKESADVEVGYMSDESTVIEQKGYNKQQINQDHFAFDDDDTWHDFEEAGSVDSDGVPERTGYCNEETDSSLLKGGSLPDQAIKRKVAFAKTEETKSGCSVNDSRAGLPPTSDLMAKLFPSLKPKQKPVSARGTEKVNGAPEQTSGCNPQSTQLRERLVEMETEIERFRMQNAALANLRQEREKDLESLRKEMADFEKKKAEELTRLEEYKKEEMRKLQKERKIFEKHAAAARAIPDKKEREEMQVLTQKVAELQEELKRKETRWSNTHNRLKKQVESLTKENTELREEITVMERLRVEAWKKIETGSENTKQAENTAVNVRRPKPISPPNLVKSSNSLSVSSMTTESHKENSSPVKVKNTRSTPTPAKMWNAEDAATAEPRNSALYQEAVAKSTVLAGKQQKVKEDEDFLEEINHLDGKVEQVLRSGSRIIIFPNGTRKEVWADGKTVKVTFFNGDVKQMMADQRVIYYYADAQTTHTTYPDGLEVLQFPNNQIEKHFPDGRKEITFPDQTIKNLYPDGQEESIFPDGTIIRVKLDGSKIIEFNNGQRELHTPEYKRREYPDGTVKTVYSNGQQETKYPTGRVRSKDKDGNIIMDTKT
ncbi:centromere protein J [Acipenser oxyrinchus oxyrinchus]|uniref:Centrosomal P4.1-associated protein n=1 Tax=Acipenser oxyrinchus oxyrinchus TaxID=40147 RepID=A0AAD8DE40_ACIOX|nr:centromere protein J [Acipenser oxyrinchus oxyrinchus]